MKRTLTYLIFITSFVVLVSPTNAQRTLEPTITFETTDNYTPSVTNAGFNRYSSASEGTSHNLENTVTGVEGSYYFLIENPGSNRSITSSDINVSGYNTLQVKILVAAPASDYNQSEDFLAIDVSKDGGSFTTVGAFAGRNGDGKFYPDNDNSGAGNGTGDGVAGTELTPALEEFTFNISGTASKVTIRIRGYTSSNTEEIVIDNIRVVGTDASNPASFTVGALTPKGGTEIAGRWNSTNTTLDVAVPIANDASLNGGTIQLQGRITSGSYADLGTPFAISSEDLGSTKTVSISATTFESIAGFDDGETVEIRAVITDFHSKSTTGTQSSTSIIIDETAPNNFNVGGVVTTSGVVVAGKWNIHSTASSR